MYTCFSWGAVRVQKRIKRPGRNYVETATTVDEFAPQFRSQLVIMRCIQLGATVCPGTKWGTCILNNEKWALDALALRSWWRQSTSVTATQWTRPNSACLVTIQISGAGPEAFEGGRCQSGPSAAQTISRTPGKDQKPGVVVGLICTVLFMSLAGLNSL